LLALLPAAGLALAALRAGLSGESELAHVLTYLAGPALWTTLKVILLSCCVSTALGVTLASVLADPNLPLRRLFFVLALLPMGLPLYVSSYLWLESFWAHARTWWAAATLAGLMLTPYVLLTSLGGLIHRPSQAFQAAEVMGLSRLQRFWIQFRWLLPWIFAGQALVAMEVLSEFGLFHLFAVQTISVVIYRTWYGLQDLGSAAQLGLMVLALVVFSRMLSGRLLPSLQGQAAHGGAQHLKRVESSRWPANAVTLTGLALILLYVTLSSGFPLYRLGSLAISHWQAQSQSVLGTHFVQVQFSRLLSSVMDSFQLALTVGLICAALGLVFVSISRWQLQSLDPRVGWASWAYALPGTLMAVAWYSTLGPWWQVLGGAGLVLALMTKFWALQYQQYKPFSDRLSTDVEAAGLMLNLGWRTRFFALQWPVFRTTFFVVFAMISIEVLKEMPLTLMLRPADWEPLSVLVFQLTSESQWRAAALPSLILVLPALVLVAILAIRQFEQWTNPSGERGRSATASQS
jgi:iron(III) transport system permease protein